MAQQQQIRIGYNAIKHIENLYPDHHIHLIHIPELTNDVHCLIRDLLGSRLASTRSYRSGMPSVIPTQVMQSEFWQDDRVREDVLLAIGGGSVMDLAKVLRFKPNTAQWLVNHLDREISLDCEVAIPLILMPTTAGTGSEVTPTATIWDFSQKKKHALFGDAVMANHAIIDPALCLGASWQITRDSALDALSHALESIWNVHHNNYSTTLSFKAICSICKYLPLIQNDLNNIEWRLQLSEAALNAGLAMAKTQTALVHALSYQDTLEHHKSHGESCAYWLPYVWQIFINSECDPSIKQTVALALENYFKSPFQMHAWLTRLGVQSVDPSRVDNETINRIAQIKCSVRGRNFAGFVV